MLLFWECIRRFGSRLRNPLTLISYDPLTLVNSLREMTDLSP